MDRRSRDLRRLVVRGLVGGGRGHLGSALSAIEIVRVLYDDIMAHQPDQPEWAERDRFLLSKGHGCLSQYAILADHGYFRMGELDRFCRFDGILGGHPDAGKVPGVEASTGALGHGPSIAVGMAIAAKLKGAAHRIFCVTGDGEINEGSVWEAAMAAGKHKLDNLTIIVDYNKLQSYDRTEVVQDLEPLTSKWESFGFAVRNVDGHDVEGLRRTFSSLPFADGRPSAVIAHTIKSRGVAHAEGDPAWHHKSKMTTEEIDGVLAAIEGEG
ncbi:MAG: transketolase [Rhodospirillaceae bacterium]|nr:transketolase [Rhodospirillaceae bacterium]MBT4688903.1 transketolase [Rhodospirillaceae bacterium]MBT5083247.1 transketolase [Rhodospirillaceae bacterium]MBT5523468.1 transketolase [Rhodospirillaceae bacterium]MBT5878575.1 transketolase [Rhodospirillaceae bacterium]